MVSLQISTDKAEYHRGESAIVRFTVTNNGNEAVYVHRHLGTCSRWTGHTELQFFDHRNQRVPRPGCDAFVMAIPENNLKEAVSNSRYWMLLLPGEIYGSREVIDLPSPKGAYRIEAELWPPGFSDREVQLLAS